MGFDIKLLNVLKSSAQCSGSVFSEHFAPSCLHLNQSAPAPNLKWLLEGVETIDNLISLIRNSAFSLWNGKQLCPQASEMTPNVRSCNILLSSNKRYVQPDSFSLSGSAQQVKAT